MYTNVPIGANGIIVADCFGKIVMMGVRGKEPKKGVLSTIGGFVELGESLEDALYREILEEINCHVVEAHYLTSIPQEYNGRMTLDTYFVVKTRGLPRPSEEITDFKFIAAPVECFSKEQYLVLQKYFQTLA